MLLPRTRNVLSTRWIKNSPSKLSLISSDQYRMVRSLLLVSQNSPQNMAKLKKVLHESIVGSNFIQATLHNPVVAVTSSEASNQQDCELAPITKVTIRPILLKKKPHYQITKIVNRQAFDENVLPNPDLEQKILELISKFQQSVIHTTTADVHVNVKNDKIVSVSAKKPTRATTSDKKDESNASVVSGRLSHNRVKSYILEEGTPVPFLVHLGVMNEQGKVLTKKYDKFRQINKFLELVQDVIPALPQVDNRLKIVDFGCGKSYLTFALYHYITSVLNREVEIIGLDLKEQVISDCNALAKKLEYPHLHFHRGDIKDFWMDGHVDMVITLHACNTATDQALCKAVTWNCATILSVPCCHQELFPQIESEPLTALLRHGILKERFSSLVTDALRAQLLEILGYKTQIMEFIDMEHTPKNLLIRAEKRKHQMSLQDIQKKVDEYLALKNSLAADPCLERLLQSHLEPILNLR